MRTLFLLSLTFICQFSVLFAQDFNLDACGKKYSYVIFDEKKEIIAQMNADEIAYPASLVKVMTLYLAFEALQQKKIQLNQLVKFSKHASKIAKVNHKKMKLRVGDKVSVETLIDAVIVKSFNEAAVTLAEAVGGSEKGFVDMMNARAKKLGMSNTNFANASGLHNPSQRTTGHDLAKLTISIKENFPQYYSFFSRKNFSYKKQKYKSHNHFLLEYAGAEGMKTGFTNASGFNLIAAARKNDKRLFTVIMGCDSHKQRDELTKQLMDKSFKYLALGG